MMKNKENCITDTEKGRRLFESFQHNVLQDKNQEIESPQAYLCRQNFRILRIGSITVIVLNLFWFIMDLVNGGALNLSHGVALVAILLLVLSSLFIFFNAGKQLKLNAISAKSAESILLLYDLCIFAAVTILKITKNMTIVENNSVSRYNSISISTYLLIVVAITPLPSIKASLILLLTNMVSLFIPLLMPCSDAYPLTQSLIFHFSIVAIYLSFRNISSELGSNIASVRRNSNILAYTSYVDPLTGLLSRRAFDEYQKRLASNNVIKNIGVFFYDIDNFKSYNDTYTHLEGDKVLEKISCAIAKAFENSNAYIFRYGGEEFVLITENTDEKSIYTDGERIRTAVHEAAIPRNDLQGLHIVTVTVGCSMEHRSAARKDIIGMADTALYHGKSGTKDCVIFIK